MFLAKRFGAVVLLLMVGYSFASSLDSLKAPFKNAYGHMRDYIVESVVELSFIINSNATVEVDDKNYPEIDAMVTAVAEKAQIEKPLTFVITRKVPNFFDKVNAFTTGDKERSVIFVGSWLIDNMTCEELEGIIAHEVIHVKKNHVLHGLAYRLGVLTASVSTIIASIAVLAKYGYLNVDMNDFRMITWGSILGAWLPTALLSARYSRSCEKEADLGAVQLTGNKKLANSLAKLDGVVKKYRPYSHWRQENSSSLLEDHPKIKERIQYIKDVVITA